MFDDIKKEEKKNKKPFNDILNETLHLVFSSTRPMPAHFTSNGNRKQSFCIDFKLLSEEIDYEMASESWYSIDSFLGIANRGVEVLSKSQLNAVIKCGEDLMVGAFIITKLDGVLFINEMKQQIINNALENFGETIEDISKVLSGKQVNKYFDHCIEFGKKQAK